MATISTTMRRLALQAPSVKILTLAVLQATSNLAVLTPQMSLALALPHQRGYQLLKPSLMLKLQHSRMTMSSWLICGEPMLLLRLRLMPLLVLLLAKRRSCLLKKLKPSSLLSTSNSVNSLNNLPSLLPHLLVTLV